MAVLGVFAGGWIMKHYDFGIRSALKFVVTSSFVSCTMLAFLLPCGCEKQKIAGLTTLHKSVTLTYQK